jgi:hypothetical protein
MQLASANIIAGFQGRGQVKSGELAKIILPAANLAAGLPDLIGTL